MRDRLTELRCERVTLSYGGRGPALDGVSLAAGPGERIAVIGPNAAGKSTLLKVLAGLETPENGQVWLNGRAIGEYSGKARARILTRVPQRPKIQAAFSVREYVAMGRYPHQRWGRSESTTDRKVVESSLEKTGLTALADRLVSELSGGEQQRVLLAQALAQETSALLLDEPNTFLDIRHQFSLIDSLIELNRQEKLTCMLVLHDLNLAASFADRMILMRDGKILTDGGTDRVLTAENIEAAYGVKAARIENAAGGRPYVMLRPAGISSSDGRMAGKRLHIIGGGGSAGRIMQSLAEAGYSMTLGAVGQGDTDLQAAAFYGIPYTETPAFSDLPEEVLREAGERMRNSDQIILANLCFGRGNLGNLQLAVDGRKAGKTVWVVEETPIESRDFTGGEATVLYRELLSLGATVVPHGIYLRDYLEESLNGGAV